MYDFGDVQVVNAFRSIEHSNVEPVSVAEKVNVELVLVLTESGAVSMTVSGGIGVAGVDDRPGVGRGLSLAVAGRVGRPHRERVRGRRVRPLYVTRVMHCVKAAPSSEHSNVVPSSLATKRKVAIVLDVGLSGARVIVVSGSSVSAGPWMFQPWRAGPRST